MVLFLSEQEGTQVNAIDNDLEVVSRIIYGKEDASRYY
jgi:hypothetical protein